MEANLSHQNRFAGSRVKMLIADNLGKAGWSLGYISGVASSGEQSSLLTLTNRTETFVD
jgi:hypothetical protein